VLFGEGRRDVQIRGLKGRGEKDNASEGREQTGTRILS